jgi:hypothetical protein
MNSIKHNLDYPLSRSGLSMERSDEHYPASQGGLPTYEDALNESSSYTSQTSQDKSFQVAQKEQQSQITLTPTSNGPSRFGKPVAIPTTVAKVGSPFFRAYPPCLAEYSISSTLFLSFLDTLNRVMVKSPPLQVLSLTGNIIGFMPSATAQIVGTAVNVAADVTAGLIQYGRTEIELKRANADIFGPRGLKVEIAKTEALVKLAGIPGVLNERGKLNKKATLLLPMEDAGPGDQMDVSGQQRRLEAMRPWIADLEFEALPEIQSPKNPLSRWSIKASEKQRSKGEQKLLENRLKSQEDHAEELRKAQEDFNKDMAEIEKDLAKDLRDIDKKLVKARAEQKGKDLDTLERQRAKVMAKYEKEKAKIEKEYHKDMKEVEDDRLSRDEEEKNMRKLTWLIIREKDAPSGDGPNPDV